MVETRFVSPPRPPEIHFPKTTRRKCVIIYAIGLELISLPFFLGQRLLRHLEQSDLGFGMRELTAMQQTLQSPRRRQPLWNLEGGLPNPPLVKMTVSKIEHPQSCLYIPLFIVCEGCNFVTPCMATAKRRRRKL